MNLDYPGDDYNAARGCVWGLIFSVILWGFVALVVYTVSHQEPEPAPRCVDPTGHYERECP